MPYFIGLLIFLLIYLFSAKHWLTARDKLKTVDAIVVPTGDMFLRCDQGIELKQKGWAKKILFSGKTGSKNVFDFQTRALSQGIKKEDIILEDRATNSLENAQFSKEILLANDYRSIILVSSPYSQKRQYLTFKKVFKKTGIEIINYPVEKYNWLIKTPGKNKYRWQYLFEEPYYIAKYWLRGDIR